MDNEYLHDFYKKQEEEHEKMRKKSEQQNRLGNLRGAPASRTMGR